MFIKKVIYKILIKIIHFFQISRRLMFVYRWAIPILLKWIGVNVEGKPRYISSDCYFDGIDYSLITICDDVVISKEVVILTHDYSITRILKSSGENLETDVSLIKSVYIGPNAFIGYRSLLMPGAYIGKNVVIGAGSVVRGKIPDNSVAFGNPAKVIGGTKKIYKKYLKDFKNNKLRSDESF